MKRNHELQLNRWDQNEKHKKEIVPLVKPTISHMRLDFPVNGTYPLSKPQRLCRPKNLRAILSQCDCVPLYC